MYNYLTGDRIPFTRLSRVWFVQCAEIAVGMYRAMSPSDDLENYSNIVHIGHVGTYESSKTSETFILADEQPKCDTDAAQMYLRQKVTDKWGAARGTPVWHNMEDDSLSLQVQVQPTICEVRGVERQSAAEVLINPSAGFEEIFTLWTEGKRWDFQ